MNGVRALWGLVDTTQAMRGKMSVFTLQSEYLRLLALLNQLLTLN